MFKAFLAALFLACLSAVPASASLLYNVNINGNGSYSVNGGATVSNNGVLQSDPSSSIGKNVLTFSFPAGLSSSPGDIDIYYGMTLAGVLRFTDATGDLTGTHPLDRVIFYSIANAGNPGDTGLPPNFNSSAFGVTANASGYVQYQAGTNVYNIQLDTTVTPEPSSFLLLGTGLGGIAGAIRKRMA